MSSASSRLNFFGNETLRKNSSIKIYKYVWGDNIKSKFLAGDLVYGFRSDFCQFPFPGCYPEDYAGIAEKMQKGETREILQNLTIWNFLLKYTIFV